MSLNDEEIIERLKIKPSDRVVDIGGSLKQHEAIAVDTLVDIVRPEEAPYWPSQLRAKKFVKADLNRDRLPFRDKEFAVCLCTHTVEDLYNPFPLLSEMGRIAKRGLIVTPSRGKDMEFSRVNFSDWRTGARRQPGNSHHHWLFEEKDGAIYVVTKNYPLLYTQEFSICRWMGEEECRFFWQGKVPYRVFNPVRFHDLVTEYRDFMKKNQKFIGKGRVLFYIDNPFRYLWEMAKFYAKS